MLVLQFQFTAESVLQRPISRWSIDAMRSHREKIRARRCRPGSITPVSRAFPSSTPVPTTTFAVPLEKLMEDALVSPSNLATAWTFGETTFRKACPESCSSFPRFLGSRDSPLTPPSASPRAPPRNPLTAPASPFREDYLSTRPLAGYDPRTLLETR